MKDDFDVFDFKEEDKIPEKYAAEILKKFKNPILKDDNHQRDPALKYQFLECGSAVIIIVMLILIIVSICLPVAQGSHALKEVGNVPCVDLDKTDCDQSFEEEEHKSKEENAFTKVTQDMVEEDLASKEENIGLDVITQCDSVVAEEITKLDEEKDEIINFHSASESGNSCLQNGIVDTTSGSDECTDTSLPSKPTSETAEDGVDDCSLSSCSSGFEMEGVVNLLPDYLEYLDCHHIAPVICFSCTGVKITVATSDTPLDFQMGIDDIVEIRCYLVENIGLAKIRLHFLSRDTEQIDNSHGASGVQVVMFTVIEPFWPKKLQEITSLSLKYSSLWHVVLDEDTELEEIRPRKQKSYLPKFDKPFDEVIYPKGDVDAVSISKRDIDLLQPETFINDTIIDFYIKYLKNQIPPDNKHKYHFFNSFFFRKLADLDKDPSSISDGRAAFLRVQKWTRKVDIFGKDYVFIPVNFNLHWSLIVICHPGDVASSKNESPDKSTKVSCILHMDSIKGSHAGLKNLVQRYLWEEWKARHSETPEDVSPKFLNFRFIPLELPQQENSFDCGLFLLHYLECFLADAPENFNPFKIDKSSNFLNANWFPSPEVSLKRALIQRLIFEVIENQLWETTSAVFDDDQSSKFPNDVRNENSVEVVSVKCNPRVACHGSLPTSGADQGIEIETTLLKSACLKNVQSVNESSSLVLRDLFEPGISAGPTIGQFESFAQPSYYHLSSPTTPKVEHVEAGGQYDDVFMLSGENNFPQINERTPHLEAGGQYDDVYMASEENNFPQNNESTPLVEAGGQYEDLFLPSEENNFPQNNESTPLVEANGQYEDVYLPSEDTHAELDSMVYTSGDFETSWNPGLYMQKEHIVDTLPDASSGSLDERSPSLKKPKCLQEVPVSAEDDVGIINKTPLVKNSDPNLEQDTDESSPSLEKIECLKGVLDPPEDVGIIEKTPIVKYSDPNLKQESDKRSPTLEKELESMKEVLDSSCHGSPNTPVAEGLRTPDEMQDGYNVDNLSENSLGQELGKVGKDNDVPCVDIVSDCVAKLDGYNAGENILGLDLAKVGTDEEVSCDEIGSDCLAELEGQQATKRHAELEGQQATKRLRFTIVP
ncbi:hypothetical protein ACFE04_025703 [Oxalis oulophora]